MFFSGPTFPTSHLETVISKVKVEKLQHTDRQRNSFIFLLLKCYCNYHIKQLHIILTSPEAVLSGQYY